MGSVNWGWNFGRTIDPTSNGFINETFFNNGLNLSSNISIYDGGRINNTIKQTKANLLATKADQEKIHNDIVLQTASGFLSVLMSTETLSNAKKQLDLTKNQQQILEKQIAVGNRPQNDMLDLEASIALNEQSIVDAENALILAKLRLQQLMMIQEGQDIEIAIPDNLAMPTLDFNTLTAQSIYEQAVHRMPEIRSAEIKLENSFLGENIAKADLLPSLGAGFSMRTNFSNKGQSLQGFDTIVNNSIVYINSQPVTVGFPQLSPRLKPTPYGTQLNDNISYGIGAQLNIPIYNNYISRGKIQMAKINTESAKLELDLQKQTLINAIAQSLMDAKAAKARYTSNEKTMKANELLYNNGLKRHEIGSLSTFELVRLKNQWEVATANTINSKYEYIFRSKVIEFYMGKPITL
jgi:outer membrane protein